MRLPALWQKNVRSIFTPGDRDAILIRRHVMRSPVAGRNALKCSKTAEGSPGRAPRGPACDYLPCGSKDSPRYFRPGDRDAILCFYLASCGSPWHFGLYKILQRWTREHLDDFVECFEPVYTSQSLIAGANKQTSTIIVRCPVMYDVH